MAVVVAIVRRSGCFIWRTNTTLFWRATEDVFPTCAKPCPKVCSHPSTRSSTYQSKLMTQDRVPRSNAPLAEATDAEIELRDQGFTKPKSLFILPTRNACMEVTNALVGYHNQSNKFILPWIPNMLPTMLRKEKTLSRYILHPPGCRVD